MNDSDGMEVKKGNHAPRYCKTCEHYKPPRGKSFTLVLGHVEGTDWLAHHCRQCKTCIVSSLYCSVGNEKLMNQLKVSSAG
jgi:hypothetical protein